MLSLSVGAERHDERGQLELLSGSTRTQTLSQLRLAKEATRARTSGAKADLKGLGAVWLHGHCRGVLPSGRVLRVFLGCPAAEGQHGSTIFTYPLQSKPTESCSSAVQCTQNAIFFSKAWDALHSSNIFEDPYSLIQVL